MNNIQQVEGEKGKPKSKFYLFQERSKKDGQCFQ